MAAAPSPIGAAAKNQGRSGALCLFWDMKKYIAESLGTFALVFCGTGAIVVNEITGGTITHVGIAVTFSLIVMAMICTLGSNHCFYTVWRIPGARSFTLYSQPGNRCFHRQLGFTVSVSGLCLFRCHAAGRQ
jgi:hypothetical protein